MRKLVILFLLVSSVSLFAQDDFIELLRQDLKTQKVAIIEKEYMGGVCLNKGCIPTKALPAPSWQMSI